MTAVRRRWAVGIPSLTLLVTGLSLAHVLAMVTGLGLLLLVPTCIALAAMPTSYRCVSRPPSLLVAALALSACCGVLVLSGLLTNLVAPLSHTSWVVSTSASSLILQAFALQRWRATPPVAPQPKPASRAPLPLAIAVLLPLLILALVLTKSVSSAHSLENKEAVISVSVVPTRSGAALIQVSCFPCATRSVAVVVSTSHRNQRAIAHLSTNVTTWARAVAVPKGSGVTVTIRRLHSLHALAAARLSPTPLRPGTLASDGQRLTNATN